MKVDGEEGRPVGGYPLSDEGLPGAGPSIVSGVNATRVEARQETVRHSKNFNQAN